MATAKQWAKLRALMEKKGPEVTLTVKQLKDRVGIFSTETLKELLIEAHRTGEIYSELLEDTDETVQGSSTRG